MARPGGRLGPGASTGAAYGRTPRIRTRGRRWSSGLGGRNGTAMSVDRPSDRITGQGRVVAPPQQLTFGRLHVLTQFDQTEGQLAAPPALGFRWRFLELLGLP